MQLKKGKLFLCLVNSCRKEFGLRLMQAGGGRYNGCDPVHSVYLQKDWGLHGGRIEES